jgi:hypothetical protein
MHATPAASLYSISSDGDNDNFTTTTKFSLLAVAWADAEPKPAGKLESRPRLEISEP